MLSNICVYQGRLPEARSHGERAIAYAGEANDRYFKGITQVYLSIAEHQAGDYVRAEDYGRAALVTLENNPSLVPFVQALLARAMRGQGRLSDALVLARQAVSQLRSLGAVGDGELWIWLALAECLEATLDLASAKQVLGQAVLRISQIADTIDEPDWRTSFLTRISENHLVLQMAKRLGVAVP
jgi:tetratricopeptide (TPR) repeat protein